MKKLLLITITTLLTGLVFAQHHQEKFLELEIDQNINNIYNDLSSNFSILILKDVSLVCFTAFATA